MVKRALPWPISAVHRHPEQGCRQRQRPRAVMKAAAQSPVLFLWRLRLYPKLHPLLVIVCFRLCAQPVLPGTLSRIAPADSAPTIHIHACAESMAKTGWHPLLIQRIAKKQAPGPCGARCLICMGWLMGLEPILPPYFSKSLSPLDFAQSSRLKNRGKVDDPCG